ncbi:MAG: hypothetical protein JNM55_20880 [Anaerolineales bacterium]|nr:hypothetical protein [Anaerolineales bacterium]
MESINKKNVSQADRLAEAVSLIFHPFVVGIPTVSIAMVDQGSSLAIALFWTVLSVSVVILPLTYLIYSKVRNGKYSDPSVSMREQRHDLYKIAAVLLIFLTAILVFGKAPTVLIASLISVVLATLISFIINRRFTKLSLHTFGVSGCAAILLLTVPMLGFIATLFIPLVAWARIHLQHHTVPQIIIGFTVSFSSVFFIFYMFHLLS